MARQAALRGRKSVVFLRRLAIAAALATMITCDRPQPTAPVTETPHAAVNAAGVSFPVEFVVVAHQDDWQRFQGDRTASAAQTAKKLVITYVTAGDAGSATVNPAFWQAREVASKA